MDIKIFKVSIEAIFKPSLTFYGKQGEIGNSLWEKNYPDWETDGKKIVFKDFNEKEVAIVEYRRVLLIKEFPTEFSDNSKYFEDFIATYKSYIQSLPESEVLRVGLRVMASCDSGLKLDEITEVIKPKIYPSLDSEIFKITSNELADVGFSVVYSKNNKKIRLQTGPVSQKETLDRTQLGFPYSLDDIPQSSLFYDIDVFMEKPQKNLIIPFFKESIELINSDMNNVNKFILG